MTYLFTSPLKNHKRENVHYIVNGYIHPLFWQNWSLFVPAPVSNKKILISFKESDSTYSEMLDPLEAYYAVNNYLRYSPQGKVILGFDNTLWWIHDGLLKLNTAWDRDLEGIAAIKFSKSYAYFMLKNLVLGAFKQNYEGEFQGAKVKFILEDVELRKTFYLIIDVE